MAHENELHVIPEDDLRRVVSLHQVESLAVSTMQRDAIEIASNMQQSRPNWLRRRDPDRLSRWMNPINHQDPLPPRSWKLVTLLHAHRRNYVCDRFER